MTGQQLRTIFFLEKYKIMSCLPLKTGTTNWQRSLISLLYVDDSGTPRLDPNDVVKVILSALSFNVTEPDRFRRTFTRNYHVTLHATISSYSNVVELTRRSCPVWEKPLENVSMMIVTRNGWMFATQCLDYCRPGIKSLKTITMD